MIDDIDDIFDLMDRMFGNKSFHSRRDKILEHDRYERLMDKDYIYYTFELRKLQKEDIDVKPTEYEIYLNLAGKESHSLKLPYPIYPKSTKVTFVNGILDIVCKMNKDEADRIEINETENDGY